MFLENENLYGESYPISEEVRSAEFEIPFGKAHIMRPGNHVTIVAYSRSVYFSLQAAKDLAKRGIEC